MPETNEPRIVPLPGSERTALGERTGDVSPTEKITISVVLKPKLRAGIPAAGAVPLSRSEFAAKHGADPAVIEELTRFATANNLKVVEVSPERRTVRIEGALADLTKAFSVELGTYRYQNVDGQNLEHRGRTGAIHVPADIADHVEAILGFDNRPQAKTHFRVRDAAEPARLPHATAISYTPVQVAHLYQFPEATGAGQTIGILELGGGYKPADLKAYFASLALSEPTVTAVSVDKGTNHPTTPSSADGEVLLDIEVAGSVAPGAKIVVYFAPNTDQGFQDALTTAIHDKLHQPSVVSISWGGPESTWTAQAMKAFDSAAQDAAALGVTICAASGDNGSADGVTDGKNHVDFPASSPHILACGGTSLQSSGGVITSETVWNDGTKGGAGGGGFSAQFPLPAWQASAHITPPAKLGRGVPDVSGDADPETGYQVLVDGQNLVIGGTSAVAPLWSGLIALLNQQLGKPVGFLQPLLYGLGASTKAFHDITTGSNGAYPAGPGWDAASGLGSPSGQNLLTALSKAGSKKPHAETES